ncbi:MAG TPA: hypothetical protein VLJ60_05475, partial [bacterium]|nr:hypothetical protein [bacterium]
MKKIFIVMIAFFPFFLSAVIGPNVSTLNGQELKWEDGPYDYFVMFKSLIEQVTGETTKQDSNPQADSCIEIDTGSTFILTPEHIPSDAYVERAFLIWIAAHDPEKFHDQTDNSVTLSFTNSEMTELTLSTEVTSDING